MDNFPITSAADWFFQRLKFFSAEKGKTPAQIFADEGYSWTFEKLFRNSVHVAAGLESMGIHAGDMASIVARNTHELYALVFGCIISGVTVTPSISELKANELRQNFLVVYPKVIFSGAPYIPTVTEAIDGLNPAPKIFEVKQIFRDSVANGSQTDPNTFKPVYIDDPKSHIISCMFSSGTTGQPKAAALTDYGLIKSTVLGCQLKTNGADGPVCNSSQMNWISWWFIVIRSLYRGWTRVFMDKGSSVSILEATHKYKPFLIMGSPITVAGMANEVKLNPGRWDLSSVQIYGVGGDIFKQSAHENVAKKLGVPVYQEYGSTEAGFVLQSPIGVPVVYGSSGKPLVPLKLVDMATREEIKEPYRNGEIVVKHFAFRYYVNNPEATAAAFDENGWFKMGDIAHFDEQGNYFIVDRVKEMFKYLGYQIAPSELEDLITRIPGVKDAGVAGKDGGIEIGNIPTAFVVKSPGSNVTEKDIHDFLAKFNLHDSKKLRGGVIFTDEIPRNVNGKIIRAKLRTLFK